MPKISIVVPVYQVEKYLPVCLDSIRAQTMRDIEIVCVNDGSSDRSRDILDAYARIDERIVVVDKENGGLSSARNAGIRAATSDVVCFVDSDDLLERSACEKIIGAFKTYDCDVVTYGGTPFPSHRSNSWLEDCLSPRDAVFIGFDPDLMFSESSHPYAWRTALRRDFILENDLFFDEDIRFGEDELFHFSVYPRSKKTVLMSAKLCRYRVDRKDSLMATRSDDAFLKAYDHLRIVEHVAADWHGLGIIAPYHRELLHHFAQFVLRDIVEAPSDVRLILLRYARSIFETYFTSTQLDSLMRDPLYGSFAKAVLLDGHLAWRGARKKMIYRYTLATDPFEFVRSLWRRVWAIRPLARCKQALLNRLPMGAREQRLLAEEHAWQSRELDDLIASKTLLDYERDSAGR